MSWLSKAAHAVTGGVSGAALGSAFGMGPFGAILGGTIGSGALGNMFHGPNNQMPQGPQWMQDQMALQAEMQRQQQLNQGFMDQTQQGFTTQNDALKKALDQYRQNAETNLTTGPEGEQFRQGYNRLGLLDSGAFNQGLANQFGNIQQQSDQAMLGLGVDQENALQGIRQQGYDTQSGLGQAGLERQFGLEDQNYNNSMSQYLAKLRGQQDTKNQLIGIGGNLLGGALGGFLGGGFRGAPAMAGAGGGGGGGYGGGFGPSNSLYSGGQSGFNPGGYQSSLNPAYMRRSYYMG